VRQPVERAELFRKKALDAQGAIEQEAAPAIGQTVIENARQAFEQGGISRLKAWSQRQAER